AAVYRICADGAANRLFDALSSRGFRDFAEAGPVPMSPSEKGQFVPPNEIVGDLDSLRPEVRQFFEQRGTQIVQRPSQYATDLQKSIQRAEDMEEESGGWLRGDLLIYGGLSGRFDQTCHTLHVLWQLAEGRNRAWVVNDDSVTWLLPAGEHDLQMSQRVMGKTCGVLPLGIGVQNGGARVVTNGLRWNLNADTGTHLGGLLSTSNHMANEDGIVKLQTDQPVYWTVELKSDAEIASAKRNL
ncbi:Thiamin pyrophosphokinase, partial [Tilletiaria anomala UBC 951]